MSLPLSHVVFHSALRNIQHTGNARRIIFNHVLYQIAELFECKENATSLEEATNAQ